MKKRLLGILVMAIVLGTPNFLFASPNQKHLNTSNNTESSQNAKDNPFVDVPKEHWAYDALEKLQKDGIIKGYGDKTFRGEKNLTRYEMALIVARTIANNNENNISEENKKILKRLSEELEVEAEYLDIKTWFLEKNADKVKWKGVIRATAESEKYDDKKTNKYPFIFRLEPEIEVNENWKAFARIETSTDMSSNISKNNDNPEIKRAFVQGDYEKLNVKAGWIPFHKSTHLTFNSNEDQFSGAEVSYGSKVIATVGGGRWSGKEIEDRDWKFNDTARYAFANVGYNGNKWKANVGLHHLKTDDWLIVDTKSNIANIWNINAKYHFDDNFTLSGGYANNTKAENGKYSGSFQIDYKGINEEKQGSWGMYVAYRYLGERATLNSIYDVMRSGQKGWEVGGQYVLLKNMVTSIKYFSGKDINEDSDKKNKEASSIWGRIEFLF